MTQKFQTEDERQIKFFQDCKIYDEVGITNSNDDRMHKKELGVFYTPQAYCKKATELVRKAISHIPKENDYIILDRCAGTGNLEEFLTDKNVDDITIAELDKYLSQDLKIKYLKDKANIISIFYSDSDFNNITLGELEKYKTKINIHHYLFDNELAHTILNTYELKEWIVLNERIGDKVKMIIPPYVEVKNTESPVNGGDALSQYFILGKQSTLNMSDEYFEAISELNGYVKNPKVNIIMFENPPYRVEKVGNAGADAGKENQLRRNRTENFVRYRMEKLGINGEWAGDLGNQFIWSAFEYYLKKQDDKYIVFSPVKYFKSSNVINKKFDDGFLFNREHFHATSSTISCILWSVSEEKRENWLLDVYDIQNNEVHFLHQQTINKCFSTFNDKYKDKYIPQTKIEIACAYNGYENKIGKKQNRYLFDDDMIAALEVTGYRVDPQAYHLTRIINYRGRGMYLSKDNYFKKLPLFCAKLYPQKNWYERDIYFTTADGGDRYVTDSDFLKSCLIFTCLSQRNHCLSFYGSDGRFYRNELCFDDETISSKKLLEFSLTETEKELQSTFFEILSLAKHTDNYKPEFTYGPYQIDQELNTRYKDETDAIIFDYPELNTKIITLKTKLSAYYEQIIQPKLFDYELLK